MAVTQGCGLNLPVRESRYEFKPGRYSSHSFLLASLPADGGGRRVLDVGCGPGYLSAELAARGYRVAAIDRPDVSPASLPEGVGFIATDLDFGVPLIDGKFSFILCGDVLEHVRDPVRVLTELRGLLEPEGRLVASLPNGAHLYVRLHLLLGVTPEHDRGLFDRTHLHYYSWRRWAGVLERGGFCIERVLPTSVPVGLAFPMIDGTALCRGLEGVSYALSRLRKQLFAYQFVITAKPVEAALSAGLTPPPRASGAGTLHEPKKPEDIPRKPKTVVVMPAYNAARTLPVTYADLPHDAIDLVILVDDGSSDETVRIARELGLAIFVHNRNYGYGANQKTCYREALNAGAEVVVMVHPDYQYDPRLLPEVVRPIEEGKADIVLGSRLLGSNPVKQGMPWWKYVANRFLTQCENWVFGQRLSEYHTGYRAFHRHVLESVNFAMNSDGFIFDQEILAQAVELRARIAEAPVPTRYFPQASSASFMQSTVYGFKILWLLLRYSLHRAGLRQRQFESLVHRYRSET